MMNPVKKFTEADASRLVSFLGDPTRPEGTMSYYQLAGFLFAVLCCPDDIETSEWLPLVFNESDPNFRRDTDADEFLPLIMALYNHINRGILEGDPALPPRFVQRADPLANLEPDAHIGQWARGFLGGYHWLEESWDTPKENEIELNAAFLVLTFFADREHAESFVEEAREETGSIEAFTGKTLKLFPNAMASFANLTRFRDEPETDS